MFKIGDTVKLVNYPYEEDIGSIGRIMYISNSGKLFDMKLTYHPNPLSNITIIAVYEYEIELYDPEYQDTGSF